MILDVSFLVKPSYRTHKTLISETNPLFCLFLFWWGRGQIPEGEHVPYIVSFCTRIQNVSEVLKKKLNSVFQCSLFHSGNARIHSYKVIKRAKRCTSDRLTRACEPRFKLDRSRRSKAINFKKRFAFAFV